ncbi:hypothetical protein QBC47DRAFT_442848, partial [Echria macrotheca]
EGKWSETQELDNVPVHASLLPNGKILYWGRRENPGPTDSIRTENDPMSWVPKPTTSNQKPPETVNPFCGGHCFLPDGKLLIVGGHWWDGQGISQACIYDYETNKFTPKAPMNGGRWYPSALTLPDGRALVISGSLDNEPKWQVNKNPEIYVTDAPENASPWVEVMDPITKLPGKDTKQGPFYTNGPDILPLYPRIHLAPDGRVFMAGTTPRSYYIEIQDTGGMDWKKEVQRKGRSLTVVGRWVDAGTERDAGFRDYAPSVMYDTGKIMYVGGGQEENQQAGKVLIKATTRAEYIDLNESQPKWRATPKIGQSSQKPENSMKSARRQFNATVLPDGTVLVTGGTSGDGFNDLSQAVRIPELFDPETNTWKQMAKESWDRCYHSVALLLPDGRVMSGGGGESGDVKPTDCLKNVQFFEPPYLLRPGTRPAIKSFPVKIVYGENFNVTLESAEPIAKISWMRLGTATHCCNMGQSLMWLKGFTQNGVNLSIPAPANRNLAPPGHYLLFVLNAAGKPSIGKIIRISAKAESTKKRAALVATLAPEPSLADPTVRESAQPSLAEYNDEIMASKGHPPVVVGISPLCPYGLGPCWAGAYDGLTRLSDIDVVCPIAHQEDSLAHVYLAHDLIPDIDKWRAEFEKTVNKSYDMRGIELTISGVVTSKNGVVVLQGKGTRGDLVLMPFTEKSEIRWDVKTRSLKPVVEVEREAYHQLAEVLGEDNVGTKMKVTGTVQKHGVEKYALDVREF